MSVFTPPDNTPLPETVEYNIDKPMLIISANFWMLELASPITKLFQKSLEMQILCLSTRAEVGIMSPITNPLASPQQSVKFLKEL
ncbi:hypothetical protein QYM36_001084 [Artemia franciscana]|uniref:Uncharacterized protein n=1 Tax=Artemia franciscana TaxID=6661 RepID=A0AA88LJS6_ARTSF|nr:hypothetical protein QYM36_001084 [Artemia franciscana]